MRIRNSFPFEWLCTRTRFETEQIGNGLLSAFLDISDLNIISEFLHPLDSTPSTQI